MNTFKLVIYFKITHMLLINSYVKKAPTVQKFR